MGRGSPPKQIFLEEAGAVTECAKVLWTIRAKFGLDNLTCILDYNKGQIDGHIKDVMPEEPIADKWKAFNWNVLTIDGHDFNQILDAFAEAKKVKGKPTFIIANTVKGKGVSFMEDRSEWHGATPNPAQAAQALDEIRKS